MRNTKKVTVTDRFLDFITRSEAMVSIVVVVLGFFVGTILVLLVGRNPSGMYSAITQVLTGWDLRRGTWNARYIGEWLVMSLPLILCGLSVAFAGRTGLFNIGAEGQYVAGLTAAQFVALFGPQIPFLHWILAILAALVVGALWGGIVGILKAKYSVSEVVATIMLNYVAYFTSRVLTMMIPGANTYRTPTYPQTARLASPFLEQLTNGSRLNYGLYLALISVLFFWIVIGKTRLGFSLRATGLNKEAARYAGINVNASITTAMAISGAFAGLAGAVVALGAFNYGRVLGGLDGYGFDGIAVALVGNSTAWGTALSGLLFGMLKSAQPLMQSRQIPKEITAIIMGLVVVFISLRAGVRMLMEWRMKEQAKKGRVIE
ncbi:ABC transporter permease [Gracilinema caldarium]|uniref:ABC-type transporter, integral membrane subunit n=1 Tax=Gracilinema caldarium (strain ATCC 51460 / DSM 7334 / H1) TaxID=744872 RepID=F8EYW6_GRAC1|nr:ABC transporter permease [Gracilinema caldarium]AEJ18912.1 ABC-type transporter, integral membrane subunit [Gracilinema caldarium DSM 7334]